MAATGEPLSNDPVIAAIDELASAVQANVEDERVLNRKLRAMRSRRVRGSSTRQLLVNEGSPETMTVLGRVLSRIGRASGIFRRALAHDLRGDGESVTSIARLFGVTTSEPRHCSVDAAIPTCRDQAAMVSASRRGPSDFPITRTRSPTVNFLIVTVFDFTVNDVEEFVVST